MENMCFKNGNLEEDAIYLGVTNIAEVVLADSRFTSWSGSSNPHHHHYGDGGLRCHTYEVWNISCSTLKQYFYMRDMGYINHTKTTTLPTLRELYLACLYHDVGKMWDYEKVDGVWTSAPHKRLVHHISRSAIEWSKAVEKTGECKDIEESVLHAILSHHGQREWGSPVAPKSKLAWLLHLSDGISARMNDADTLDIISANK